MITQLSQLPAGVVGFVATGKVTAADYESVVIPAVDAVFASYTSVRCLYRIDKDFEGFEIGALWDDAKVGLKHYSGWERIALVTDHDWIRAAVTAFSMVIPAEIRLFNDADFTSAMAWVSE